MTDGHGSTTMHQRGSSSDDALVLADVGTGATPHVHFVLRPRTGG